MVESRCAIAITVLPVLKSSKASWILRSLSVSKAEVASSNNKIGASRNIARAIDSRCCCPPLSRHPLSPTTVS